MKNLSKNERMKVIKSTRKIYKDLIEMVQIKDMNKPMEHNNHPEIGICNPYSKVSCFILYIYSMEWGSPPFYAEVNRIAREMDLKQLKRIGPFIRALSVIAVKGERGKDN